MVVGQYMAAGYFAGKQDRARGGGSYEAMLPRAPVPQRSACSFPRIALRLVLGPKALEPAPGLLKLW
jgi:hypothetical protein